MKYVKRNVEVVEAIQFLDTPERLSELSDFIGREHTIDYKDKDNPILKIKNMPTGTMVADVGDFIIKVAGENFRAAKPESFLSAHDLAETPRDRMEIESRELSERILKLSAFIESDKFENSDLTEDERKLLMIQYENMLSYSHTLDMRIRAYNKKMLGGSPR